MPDSAVSPFEAKLMQAIEDIEAKVKELEQERSALKRQLMKARWENSSLRDVTRKNSANRVMVESRIVAALDKSMRPLSSKKLFTIACLANFELRENTFRTQLFRMKEKGMIESAGWGLWRLPRP